MCCLCALRFVHAANSSQVQSTEDKQKIVTFIELFCFVFFFLVGRSGKFYVAFESWRRKKYRPNGVNRSLTCTNRNGSSGQTSGKIPCTRHTTLLRSVFPLLGLRKSNRPEFGWSSAASALAACQLSVSTPVPDALACRSNPILL